MPWKNVSAGVLVSSEKPVQPTMQYCLNSVFAKRYAIL